MEPKIFGPIHPGEHLQEDFMKPLGLTQSQLAADLAIPFRRINEIVNGKRAISAETALLLGHYFNISAEFWLRLQADYDLECERERIGSRLARVKLRTSKPA